ncbi:formimidoyltransferase-cyclodeaminase-like isoform X2 [Lycorma delicatula]|uniref:formimidoyltransferase-cyclodeaminase-like isoform X2 n=1 Tax=Lycorma delicatula TaxID=130591 RepID=UPI003F513CE0
MTIDAIAEAITGTDGVTLLDVDPGSSTNRTVYTFVGTPDGVVNAALNAAIIGRQKIDMTKHKGEHPRLGAMDVCPFIPVRNVTIEDCIACATKLAAALSKTLSVPVYMYGAAAKKEYRKTVPQIRSGEYEGLQTKILQKEWAPDYGPSTWVPEWGATMVGVRDFLIAYNINLLSTKEQAHRIALNIRETGRGEESPGRLKAVQGIGWWLDEANLAQVSLNLLNYKVTPIHKAYEEVCKDANELNVAVVGSEIVGLVPLDSILQAAEFYIKKEKLFVLEEDQKVCLALSRLGLKDFNPKKRIIEYCLVENNNSDSLLKLSAEKFIRVVGARTSAPGGGSVSAYVGALGAGLGTMVGLMTFGKKQWDAFDSTMRKLIPPLYDAMNEIMGMVDADTNAFNRYMEALKLPKSTAEENKVRDDEIEKGLLEAIDVPLNLARKINTLWPILQELAKIANVQTGSDLQVGVRCLTVGVWGAYYNVIINLKQLKNEVMKQKLIEEVNECIDVAQASSDSILSILQLRI